MCFHQFYNCSYVCYFVIQLVQSLGVVVFQALDFGLSETEEQRLSPPLEQLIARMTGSDLDDDNAADDKDDDEGIEDDDTASTAQRCSLAEVIEVCNVMLYRIIILADACSFIKFILLKSNSQVPTFGQWCHMLIMMSIQDHDFW